ncbi:MAG: hypothetical protein ACSHX7_12485 [Luteolibacter sp.]
MNTIIEPADSANQSTPSTTEKVKAKVQNSLETARETTSTCCNTITKQTNQLCECTTNAIRKNPVSSVIGAAVFGAAVAYLILEGRKEMSFTEKYLGNPLANAGDTVGNSARSAYDNLKFW